jgi:hypothetical protein
MLGWENRGQTETGPKAWRDETLPRFSEEPSSQ